MKRMLMLLVFIILLTGCTDGIKTPIDLIARPQLPNDRAGARDLVETSLPPSGKLIRPYHSDNLKSVDYFDWDSDGVDEVYAFYSDPINLRTGVMVVDYENDQWHMRALIEEVGSDIDFASFVNFNGDAHDDIILGLTTEGEDTKSLAIYEWKEGQYIRIVKDVYTELIIADVDRNFVEDVFVVKLDRNTASSAKLLSYESGQMRLVDEVQLDAFINGYYNIQFGKASSDKYGFFMDFQVGSKTASNILIVEGNALVPVFDASDTDERYKLTLKDKVILSKDIDNDKIIEIGNTKTLEADAEGNLVQTSLETWYKWDGEKGLVPSELFYLDPRTRYRFRLPHVWNTAVLSGQMTFVPSQPFDQIQSLTVHYAPDEITRYQIFTIEEVDTTTYEQMKQNFEAQKRKLYRLGSQGQVVFVGYERLQTDDMLDEHRDAYMQLMIDDVELESRFEILD